MEYQEFLESKVVSSDNFGFQINESDLHPSTKPHQRDIIIWAAQGGRRAIFAHFGLGKTHIQLELARICIQKNGGMALIVCPLGVKQEFKKEAQRLGIEVAYCKTMQEVKNCEENIILTNYERVRDGNINPEFFAFASLDEAAVLRSFGSKTYQEFLPKFAKVPYRYVCTATPSPNKYKELIHYAGFLGVMDTGQALTRFFKRDSTKANHLTIHPHKEKEFWLWMSMWAVFVTKPSDLGYSDEGYELPPILIKEHQVNVKNVEKELDRDGNLKMFRQPTKSLSASAKEKRISLSVRIKKAISIVSGASKKKHWILWHHLEDERKAIQELLPEASAVFGSQSDDVKEDRLIRFSEGEDRVLATKPEIAGSGCNFQHYCHEAIFCGINYKFNDFIQAVHRIHRYGQNKPVTIHLIFTDAEEGVYKALMEKWERHDELVKIMTGLIKEHGLANISKIGEMKRSIGVERKEISGEYFKAVHNDCVEELKIMEENSVDLIHTSIPFSNHYEYTPSYNDFGHNDDDARFFNQMDYLVPELHRVLKPGRVAAIHVKDRILYGNVTGLGMPSVNPFSDLTTRSFIKHGFVFFGRITVVTDVVRENNQTYRLGWSEQCKDGTKMGVGMPEYILLFRKLPTDTSNAYADVPVTKSKEDYTRAQWQIDAHGFWRSSGDRFITPEELNNMGIQQAMKLYKQHSINNVYNYEEHIKLGEEIEESGNLPASFMMFAPQSHNDLVWSDVNRMRTLNTNQSMSREQNHICPLQFDIVDRIINRYSNPDELVLDPFGGLMTVPYRAIHLGRKGYGIELNPEYWGYGVKYCREAEYQRTIPTLFDELELAEVG
jgi:DNA modification methylase